MKQTCLATLALVVLGASMTYAQATYKRDIPEALAKDAKITEAAASAIAQKRVPAGVIQAVELEREGGKLIYSYEIKVPKKSGIEEVNVDGMTGNVVAVKHESAATEKKEAAADAKAAKKAAKTPKKP